MKKFLLTLMLFSSAFSQNLTQDKSILSGKLENGLKFYIKENPLPKKTAYFYLILDHGAIDEKPNERGLAHFIEHMAFNGSKDFEKNDLIKTLESLGVDFGADLNAQTQYDKTAYILNIPVSKENLDKVFLVYNNWIDGIKFDPVELDKERGVILSEERARNSSEYRLYVKIAKDLFAGSVYENALPIGDTSVIQNVTSDEIKALYQRIYQPRDMSFVAVGDFDKNEILNQIKAKFSDAKNTNDYTGPSREIPLKSELSIYNYDSNESAIDEIQISFFDKFTPKIDEKSARKILLSSYISNLLNMLYEQKNNAEGSIIKASFDRSSVQNQLNIYHFSVPVINAEFQKTLDDTFSVLKGVQKHGFSKDDFKDVKNAFIKAINVRYEKSKTKKSSEYLHDIITALNTNSVVLSDEDSKNLNLKLIDEITLDEVNAEFNRILSLSDERVNVLSKNAYQLSKEKFNEIYTNATPYTGHLSEQNIAKYLIDEELKPGKITAHKHNEKLGLDEFYLQNGAKVVLKNLKTKKNTVLFSAVSKGGTSDLQNPKDGVFAVNTSNLSGVGKFNNYELEKFFHDKRANYEKSIDRLSSKYHGSSDKSDIEYLFQALYLEFTSPRLDEKILKKVQTTTLDGLSKNQTLPEYKFHEEFIKFYYNDNKRINLATKDDVNNLKLENLTKIINDKFTNPSDFTFIFVGDFELEVMKNFIEKYIASIPKKAISQNLKDDGVRPINGVHKFSKSLQSVQKSEVSINFYSQNTPYSPKDLIISSALKSVLAAALREQIREDKGQTYSFGVKLNLHKEPFLHSTLKISFVAEPSKTDEILSQIDEIRSEILKNGLVKDEHLENYKKSALVNIDKNYDQPDFWLGNIASSELNETEILDIKEYEKMIISLTKDDLKFLASHVLNGKNITTSINEPKK